MPAPKLGLDPCHAPNLPQELQWFLAVGFVKQEAVQGDNRSPNPLGSNRTGGRRCEPWLAQLGTSHVILSQSKDLT